MKSNTTYFIALDVAVILVAGALTLPLAFDNHAADAKKYKSKHKSSKKKQKPGPENYINVQKEIINSMQSSLLPYWENFYALFGNGWWISPRRMIEAYANMVSSFAGNTLRTTQLVNNSMLANMDAFKKTVDHARENSNDLARACVNFAKKIERDSLDVSDNNAVAQGSAAENVKTLKIRKTE